MSSSSVMGHWDWEEETEEREWRSVLEGEKEPIDLQLSNLENHSTERERIIKRNCVHSLTVRKVLQNV